MFHYEAQLLQFKIQRTHVGRTYDCSCNNFSSCDRSVSLLQENDMQGKPSSWRRACQADSYDDGSLPDFKWLLP